MKKSIALAFSALIIAAVANGAFSQCTKDSDCKGNRICVQGECREPDTVKAAQPVPAREKTEAHLSTESSEHHNSGGFATGSAIAGFVVSPIILGLCIGSASTEGEDPASLPLGASGLLLDAITVPIISIGGSSARSGEKVDGVVGLRISGWCEYGLFVGAGVVMIGLAIANVDIPQSVAQPVIASEGIVGSISCISLSIDALVSGKQARKQYAGVEKSDSGPELTLGVGPCRNNGAAVQLGLRF